MAKLKSGAEQAHGGKREGAGRKPDWLKEKCRKLIESKKLLDFVARVASGEETEVHYDKLGNAFEGACSIKDRLHAFEILTDRGFGKPAQDVSVSAGEGTAGRFILVCPDTGK